MTSGRFTDEAISFASGRLVTLRDGRKLHGRGNKPRRASNALHPRNRLRRRLAPLLRQHRHRLVLCVRSPWFGAPPTRRQRCNECWGCAEWTVCRGTRTMRPFQGQQWHCPMVSMTCC